MRLALFSLYVALWLQRAYTLFANLVKVRTAGWLEL